MSSQPHPASAWAPSSDPRIAVTMPASWAISMLDIGNDKTQRRMVADQIPTDHLVSYLEQASNSKRETGAIIGVCEALAHRSDRSDREDQVASVYARRKHHPMITACGVIRSWPGFMRIASRSPNSVLSAAESAKVSMPHAASDLLRMMADADRSASVVLLQSVQRDSIRSVKQSQAIRQAAADGERLISHMSAHPDDVDMIRENSRCILSCLLSDRLAKPECDQLAQRLCHNAGNITMHTTLTLKNAISDRMLRCPDVARSIMTGLMHRMVGSNRGTSESIALSKAWMSVRELPGYTDSDVVSAAARATGDAPCHPLMLLHGMIAANGSWVGPGRDELLRKHMDDCLPFIGVYAAMAVRAGGLSAISGNINRKIASGDMPIHHVVPSICDALPHAQLSLMSPSDRASTATSLLHWTLQLARHDQSMQRSALYRIGRRIGDYVWHDGYDAGVKRILSTHEGKSIVANAREGTLDGCLHLWRNQDGPMPPHAFGRWRSDPTGHLLLGIILAAPHIQPESIRTIISSMGLKSVMGATMHGLSVPSEDWKQAMATISSNA